MVDSPCGFNGLAPGILEESMDYSKLRLGEAGAWKIEQEGTEEAEREAKSVQEITPSRFACAVHVGEKGFQASLPAEIPAVQTNHIHS